MAAIASMALQGAAAPTALGAVASCKPLQKKPSSCSWICRAVDEEIADMSNVGLDDVFNLIQQVGSARVLLAFLFWLCNSESLCERGGANC